MYSPPHICTHRNTHTWTHMHIDMHVYSPLHIGHTGTHTRTLSHTEICIYTHPYTYVHIETHIPYCLGVKHELLWLCFLSRLILHVSHRLLFGWAAVHWFLPVSSPTLRLGEFGRKWKDWKELSKRFCCGREFGFLQSLQIPVNTVFFSWPLSQGGSLSVTSPWDISSSGATHT